MNFIAVDMGSTFIKAAVYDLKNKTLLWQQSYNTPEKRALENPSYFEVDATEFIIIIKKIIKNIYQDVGKCEGILFSTQQHGCVLSHPDCKEDTYISWQDTRCMNINPVTGISYLEELEGILSKDCMNNTGVPIKPALALCNLYTLFEKGTLAKSKGTKIYTIGSYVINALTGNNICHITNAAPMGFTNILDKTWRYDILEKVGLDFLELPEITDDMSCTGYYHFDGNTLPVYTDVGDVQMCAYGTGANVGDLVVHIGTSGQLIYISDECDFGDYETRPYFDGKYCKVISRMPGGRNFDVQIQYMQEIGEKIFNTKLSNEDIWKKIHKLPSGENMGELSVDCGFYELPDSQGGDGNISHINHINFEIKNVINATAVDFGKKYRYFANYLCDCDNFKGSLYYAGGAVLKNNILRSAISNAMGIEDVTDKEGNEVYEGMLRLSVKCISKEVNV